jgi:nitrile hydratase beta subunit
MPYVSHADLGGLRGFGPVVMDDGDGPFHAAWEAHVHALTLAMGATGMWNLDMTRAVRETLPQYRQLSYYEKWLAGLEEQLLEVGLVTRDEIAAGKMLVSPVPIRRVLHANQVLAALAKGAPTAREPIGAGRFQRGDIVRTRADVAPHHTRLPGYLRGKTGLIEHVRGAHVFADANAQGMGENPEWLYSVAFDAAELWGDEAEAGQRVSFDAWEPYLESA